MLSTAIIGVSGFGRIHYDDLLTLTASGKAKPVAATIINQSEEPEKCARLHSLGCRIFTDYKEMLSVFNGKLDMVMIPTGIALHEPMTVAALEAGANVFVEKPISGAIQYVESMQRVQAATGKKVAVGYQNLYDPLTLEVKQAILDGKIGDLRCVKCWALWPRPDSYYARNNWAAKLKQGDTWILDSPINNALAHYVIQMLFFAGNELRKGAKLKSVCAELYRARDIESLDTASMRARTTGGVPIFFHVSHACSKNRGPFIEIHGSNGVIHWKVGAATLKTNDGQETELKGNDLRESIWDAVCAAFKGEDRFICDLELAKLQTICINGAHESRAIQQIPDALIQLEERKGSELKVIDGIDDVIQRAFKEEKLFSELGVKWATPAAEVDLQGYSHFPSTD